MTSELKAKVCELFEFGEDKWFDYESEFVQLAEFISAPYKEEISALRQQLAVAREAMEKIADTEPDNLDFFHDVANKAIAALGDAKPASFNIAKAIHYPECWDTACYPTVADALREIATFCCSNEDCAQPASAEVKPFGYAECAKFHPPTYVTPSQEAPREVIEARALRESE